MELDDYINWGAITTLTGINIYRILQEIIQNTIKHAKAKTLKFSFSLDKNILIKVIEDDGVGFNVKKKSKGIGLKNITSRLKKINGNITINSKINVGTIQVLKIPID